MLKTNKTSIIIFIVFILFSCQRMSRKEGIKKIVQEWQEKEILIPDNNISIKFLGRDTLCSDLWNKPFKIFTYIDSIGCTSCQLGVLEWSALINTCRQQQIDVGFIFVVHSSDFKRFDSEIQFHEFDYPIIFDYKNQFHKINQFPHTPFRTFLLDKNNKVKLIGSPINNPQMWELYKKTITQQ